MSGPSRRTADISIETAGARAFLDGLPADHADLVIADYPFDADRSLLDATAAAFERVLKPEGNLAVIHNPHGFFEHGEVFASRFGLRNEVILPKADPLYPNNHLGFQHNSLWLLYNEDNSRFRDEGDNAIGQTDVWDEGPAAYSNGYHAGDYHHPQAVPRWVIERVLRLTTFEGDQVVDPFVGSGTTAAACWRLVRDLDACDRDPEHVRHAQVRYHNQPVRLKWWSSDGGQSAESGGDGS